MLKVGPEEVRYDMQILADRIEFCWIHLRGIGTLENSLWGYDGSSIRVWLDALTMEGATATNMSGAQGQVQTYQMVKESVNIPLTFYPLCEEVQINTPFHAWLTLWCTSLKLC